MISVSNLSMRYGAKVLFEDVTINFIPGRRYGLTGPNGSGKSTFMKVLANDLDPQKGIVVRPRKISVLRQDQYAFDAFRAIDTVIMGNTCLYGATGGELYAAGRAGERFAVRNSGALAVVEGTGDHCCEYMTGGVVCVLGTTGVNFGAGFTGGFAYVLDMERDFVDRYNHDLIDIHRVSPEGMGTHVQHLRGLIEQHVDATGSEWGAQLLNDFRTYIGRFWVVKPKASAIDSLLENLRRAA